MRVLFAKQVSELNKCHKELAEYDFMKEKTVPISVKQGKLVQSRKDFDELRKSSVQFKSIDFMTKTQSQFVKAKPFDSIQNESQNIGNLCDNTNIQRPQTHTQGRRIFEAQFYVSQPQSQFRTSKKVFTNVKTEEEKKGRYRPQLNSYKREFSKPDYMFINVPKVKKQDAQVEVRSSFASPDEDQRKTKAEQGESLLSKHNGWITIDPEHTRKQAPETFQNTNPNQRNRLKPTWMKIAVDNSLDMQRYKKFAIDLQKTTPMNE